MKKFWKYFSISLMLLVGLFCIGLIYLFFDQNASIFGLTYISHNTKVESKTYETTAVDTIVLNTRAYDIKVLQNNADTIQLTVCDYSYGYTTTKHSTVSIGEKLKSGTLTFSVAETYGAVIKNGSYINLYIPKNFAVNLTLTNKKADTVISGDELKLNNLSYQTNSGDLTLKEFDVAGNLNLSINSSICKIENSVTTHLNATTLTITKGRFEASSSTLGAVTIKNNKRGIIKIDKCASLYQNESSSGGSLTINRVGTINFVGSTTNITIDMVTTIATINNKGGYVVIGSIDGNSRITTEGGNVEVETNLAPLDLETTTGNVTIKKARAKIKVVTNKGAVNVNFDETCPDYDAVTGFRTLNAVIKSGSINATGVQHTELEIQEGGSANISMNKIAGENDIKVLNGTLNLTIAYDAVYTLKTSANGSASMRVNLLQIPNYRGYTQTASTITNVNCSSTSANTLTVYCEKGSATILDTQLN